MLPRLPDQQLVARVLMCTSPCFILKQSCCNCSVPPTAQSHPPLLSPTHFKDGKSRYASFPQKHNKRTCRLFQHHLFHVERQARMRYYCSSEQRKIAKLNKGARYAIPWFEQAQRNKPVSFRETLIS